MQILLRCVWERGRLASKDPRVRYECLYPYWLALLLKQLGYEYVFWKDCVRRGALEMLD